MGRLEFPDSIRGDGWGVGGALQPEEVGRIEAHRSKSVGKRHPTLVMT